MKKLRKNLLFMLGVTLLLGFSLATTAGAKSLYMATQNYKIATYNISPVPPGPPGLTFQADGASAGWGAVGVAVDSDNEILFITYEGEGWLQIMDPTTFAQLGTVTAPGARNLAGIVYDHDKGRMYCVDRGRTNLYVYDWDATTYTLTAVAGSPFTLPGTSTYGIALDEINDLLYVANRSTTINIYNTVDWSSAGTITTGRTAVSVAVDATNQLLYYGGGFAYNYYLCKYDLNLSSESEVYLGSYKGVMGIAVDPATSLVYISTGFSGDELRIFDTSLAQQFSMASGYSSPTGIAIPGKDVSYNPLNLDKDDGLDDTTECLDPGEQITYTIGFDNTLNPFDVGNVTITDTIPTETSFVSATGGGIYDSPTRTVTWNLGTLLAGASGSVQLVVQVNSGVTPGSTIHNNCTIDSDDTPPTTQGDDTVVCLGPAICGDFNHDGAVDVADYYAFLSYFGSSPGDPNWNAEADFDGDGVVALPDFAAWYQCWVAYVSGPP
ncbi:MAG: DUF11 domain-containing protein [Deltaproteobacteria bacterium]|nr:DUF11 domain-containing protein [Deltaproteobacteria bacterium]MBW1793551.1 DUF11 domain-containing protein [Deltaproteobacteria bacterium]MBW2330617.1 DUF11 domain-containing protein [Deltaproteobacteria bacterium]